MAGMGQDGEAMAMESQASAKGSNDAETSQPWMFGGHLEPVRLPWAWATARFTRAHTYWIATTCLDGHPHSRPVWGIWLDDVFYFSTGSRAAQNLAANPAITVHLGGESEVVIIEGAAQPVGEASLVERVVELYNQKYHWDVDPSNLPGPFYAVRPQVAFGWLCDESGLDRGSAFHGTATRWRFATPKGARRSV